MMVVAPPPPAPAPVLPLLLLDNLLSVVVSLPRAAAVDGTTVELLLAPDTNPAFAAAVATEDDAAVRPTNSISSYKTRC